MVGGIAARPVRCQPWGPPLLQGVPRTGTKPRAFERVTADRGFLPLNDPCTSLTQPQLAAWEAALEALPKYAVAAGRGELRAWLCALPDFDLTALSAAPPGHLWRAYLLISFLAHAYMWCDGGPEAPPTLPAKLAAPWCSVAAAVGMPPVLTYATYNLYNWRRLDPQGPVALGNIVCLANFLGGIDEEWFRLVHVEIEARAAPAVAALPAAQRAAAAGDTASVLAALEGVAAALEAMQDTLGRMGEKCDPGIYYQRVRAPMQGWRGNPALPQGLVYEGTPFGSQPQQLYGETGAQSPILHALDAALGIEQSSGWLQEYLLDMRAHMPPAHRDFLAQLEQGPSLRQAVQSAAGGTSGVQLRGAYNECVVQLEGFRSQHKGFARAYIARQSERGAEERGTGGSDFMPALAGYRDATARHLLP